MKHTIQPRFIAALAGALLTGSIAGAQTVVYTETFDLEPSSVTDFSVSLGGDAGDNNKEVVIGQWGITANGSFAGGVFSPQNDGSTNVRMGGVFLDSTTLDQGAGTYVLEFDVIGADAGASYVFVSTGSGYDSANFLVLDLANGGYPGWEPLSATGTATASQLAALQINTTLSQSGLKIFFPYDGTSVIAIGFSAYDSDVAFDNITISTSPAYETDFEGFVLGTHFLKDFNIAYGGTAPVNTKRVSSGQWGITSSGNDFAGGILRPQLNPATNVRMAGIFLDPIVFTSGPGTYEISFELTGDAAGDAAYQAFVFAGSGYDLSGTIDDRLQLSLAAPGFGGYLGMTAVGNATASQLVQLSLGTEASTAATTPVTLSFNWDGTSAIAFAIGGYNNAATIDNFTVSSAISVSGPVTVTGTLVNGGGDFVIDFQGDPSTAYEVTKSSILSGFVPLTSPLVVTTDGSGVGQAVVPAAEISGARQFFRLENN